MKGTRAGLFVLMVSLALALFAGQANAAPSAVYVADYGANKVVVVNLDSYTHKEISVPTPYGITITPDKLKAYTANKDNGTCSVLDLSNPANITVKATISVGAGAQHVAITPDATTYMYQKWAYVANTKDDFISVVDTGSDTLVPDPYDPTIPLKIGIPNVSYTTVSSNGQWVFATMFDWGSVYWLDSMGNEVNHVTPSPQVTCAVLRPPDDKELYVSSQSAGCIYILDADPSGSNYLGLKDTIPGAYGLRMLFFQDKLSDNPKPKLFVTNGSCLQIIDVASKAVTAPNQDIRNPVGLALTADETQLLVSGEVQVEESGVLVWKPGVAVINPTTNAITKKLTGFSSPAELAIGPAVPEPPPPPPSELTILIDIKPGSFPNSINPKSQGKIPVAILSGGEVSPGMVDTTSLTFGRTGGEESLSFVNPSAPDLNGDGIGDLICHFWTQVCDFKSTSAEGILKGKTLPEFGGKSLQGKDSVRIVPAK